MPELPEVETVKNSLKKKLINKKIMEAIIYHDNIISYPNSKEFSLQIKGQTIHNIDRLGKWLIFILDDFYLLSHLRMEGKYFFKDSNQERSKYEHVIFKLEDQELRYHDVRKFGKMYLIKKEEIDKIGPLKDLGLEPWDKKLTGNYLKKKYEKKRLPIKTVLLDQSIITGIGNIYADEILFLSKISPLKEASKLKNNDLDNIIKNTQDVLASAIKMGGTTIRSYTSVDGVNGRFQQQLYVHGKEKQLCPICHKQIFKIKVGGRGTYYCPYCQADKNNP